MYDHDEATSATLLDRLRDRNDHDAWLQFVRRYEPGIRKFCARQRLSNERTDEIVAEVNMTLVKTMSTYSYDSNLSFRGWLMKVVRSRLVDTWRMHDRHQDAEGGTIALEKMQRIVDQLSDDISVLVDEDRLVMSKVVEAVKERAPKSWEAYDLRILKGVSGADAAKQLGMSVASVHVAVNRAKTMLEEEGKKFRLSHLSETI